MSAGKRHGGFVLVAVLWLLAIFSIVALGYSRTTRFKTLELVNELRFVSEEYAHWNGLEKASFHVDLYRRNMKKFLLTENESVFTESIVNLMWFPRYEAYTLSMDNMAYYVRVEHVGSRISFSRMSNEMWPEVLLACGIEDIQEQRNIIDALADWQDADNLLHMDGAEQDFYDGLDPAYACKNAPVNDIDELLLVRGITPELLYGDLEHPGLVDFLCIEGKSDKLDINAANPLTFRIVRGLPDNVVEHIVSRRQTRPFANISEAAELMGLEAAGELMRFYHVLPVSGNIRLIIGNTPDLGSEVRTTTRTLSR